MYKWLLHLICFMLFSISGWSMEYHLRHVPIDSISKKDITSVIYLDCKNKQLTLNTLDTTITYKQTYTIDTSEIYSNQQLEYNSDFANYSISQIKLVDFDKDSIYLKLFCEKKSKANNKSVAFAKIKRMGIAKSSLIGVVAEPNKKKKTIGMCIFLVPFLTILVIGIKIR